MRYSYLLYRLLILLKTGVPIERQILSEWFDGHVFKLFSEDNLSVAHERMLESDQFRMDEIPDPVLVHPNHRCMAHSSLFDRTLVDIAIQWNAPILYFSIASSTLGNNGPVIRRLL